MLTPINSIIYTLALGSIVFAVPAERPGSWTEESSVDEAGYLTAFAIPNTWADGGSVSYSSHSSCNATQKRLIKQGLAEALTITAHGRSHLRRFQNDSFFNDWFNPLANSNELLGLYDRIVDGDKSGLMFRCDDPDALCNGKYGVIAGYFRPDAKDETVICPTYYLSKESVENMCTKGQTLQSAGSEASQGSFMMHRLLHNPKSSGGRLSDVVDSAEEALELAIGVNYTSALKNIHSIQYYALDTYAHDILLPGVGCRGDKHQASNATEKRALNFDHGRAWF